MSITKLHQETITVDKLLCLQVRQTPLVDLVETEGFLRQINSVCCLFSLDALKSEKDHQDLLEIITGIGKILSEKSSNTKLQELVNLNVQKVLSGKTNKIDTAYFEFFGLMAKIKGSDGVFNELVDDKVHKQILGMLKDIGAFPDSFHQLRSPSTIDEMHARYLRSGIHALLDTHCLPEYSESRENLKSRAIEIFGNEFEISLNRDPIEKINRHIEYLLWKGNKTNEVLLLKNEIVRLSKEEFKFPKSILNSFSNDVTFLDIVPDGEEDKYLHLLTKAFTHPIVIRKHLVIAMAIEGLNAKNILDNDIQALINLSIDEALEIVAQSEGFGDFARFLTNGSTKHLDSAFSKIANSEFSSSLNRMENRRSARELESGTGQKKPSHKEPSCLRF